MIGQKLSHFRILDRIGEGGMGVVFRAEDEKLQRVVALKVLPSERLADEERRLRFVREARTAAAVTHPNIAVVHEIDEADGIVFIAMELIEGKTLRETIGGKPLPLREALRLGVEIAEGLSAAHHARVIHRDLKPDNVIVTPGGHAKILDFGLAKLLDERGTAEPGQESKLATISDEMTQAGRVLGTASYMSPEQARGLAVDARSDLFSFGIVLYEMVTGKAPFRGSTSMDTLTAILREQPVPAVQLNPEVPAELERIIGKCLEKEPGERYQDSRDLVVDLRKLKRDTESTGASRAVTGPAAASRRPRRLVWAGAVALLPIIAVLAAWLALVSGRAARDSPLSADATKSSTVASVPAQGAMASVVVLPFANMSSDPNNEYFADGLAEELLNGLAKVSGMRVIGRTSSFQFKGKNEDVREIGRKLNVAAVLEGSVRKSGNQVRITVQLLNAADGFHLWSETYDRTLDDILAVQDEITRAAVGALKITLLANEGPVMRGGTSNIKAYDACLQGRFLMGRWSEDNLRMAIGKYQAAVALDPGYALAWIELATAYSLQAGFGWASLDDARRRAEEALDRARALDANLPELLAASAAQRVNTDMDYARAYEETKRVLATAPDNPGIAGAAANWALAMGRFEEVNAFASRFVQLDPLNVNLITLHTVSLLNLGRSEEAETFSRRAVELQPESPFLHWLIAYVHLARGRAAAALVEAERETQPTLRLSLLAAAYHALGRTAESEEALAGLIEQFSDTGAYQVAEVYAFRGEADMAFEWLERARDQRDGGLWGVKWDIMLAKIRGDARYTAFLKKMHLAG